MQAQGGACSTPCKPDSESLGLALVLVAGLPEQRANVAGAVVRGIQVGG